jgi:hypothetical protein
MSNLWDDLGIRPPKGRFVEASILLDTPDGHVSGHGSPAATWLFDVLTIEMVAALRAYCPGRSAAIYLRTLVAPDSQNAGESYRLFDGIMVWPTEEYMSRRQVGGRYMGIEFQFRGLTAHGGAFSVAFNSAYDVVA